MMNGKTRESYKKERFRVIGKNIADGKLGYYPITIPTFCPICGGNAWIHREIDIENSTHVLRCLEGTCPDIKNLVIKTDSIEVKQ